MGSSSQAPTISNFVPELLDRLYAYWDDRSDRIGDWNIHRVFGYWSAELLDTTDEDFFTFSDGADDRGIDYFTVADHVYVVYQTKCPTQEKLEELAAANQCHVYDAEVVNEIVEGIHFLQDKESNLKANKDVQLLRHDYHASLRQAAASTKLDAVLVVAGELSESARQHLESEQRRLAEAGVQLRCVDWSELASRTRPVSEQSTRGATVTFTLDKEGDPLQRAYWAYFLARGGDLVKAYRDHGYALFDWNVRAQLKRSAINRKIRDSLATHQGRKRFHHLNNGLLVCARTVEFKKGQGKGGLPPRVVLHDPQIINGCQTVTALYDAWRGCQNELEVENFEQTVRVQVKVIDLRDPAMDEKYISDLIISTNDQNPMSPRNLKSNTPVQIEIQRQFRSMAVPCFYERKDGEFDAVLAEKDRRGIVKPQLFRLPETTGNARKNFRVFDNDRDVARSWYALLGFSGRATMGTVKPFEAETVYRHVFLEQPTTRFWEAYADPEFPEPDDDLFASGEPSAYQMLMGATLSRFALSHQVTSRLNRQLAVRRLVERNKVDGTLLPDGGVHVTEPEEKLAQLLLSDTEYNVMRLLDNAQSVMTELLAFLLVRRYGSLEPVVARRMLAYQDVASFVVAGWQRQSDAGQPFGLLETAYQHTRFCFEQYFLKHRNEILTAPRGGRTHFGKRDNIIELRREIVAEVEESKGINFPWKPLGESILERLPEIDDSARE